MQREPSAPDAHDHAGGHGVEVEITGPIIEWRGPAPHHFVRVPDDESDLIESLAGEVSYGWGMVPVQVSSGRSRWRTALWPRDGGYVVPIRADVRRREHLELGDTMSLTLTIGA